MLTRRLPITHTRCVLVSAAATLGAAVLVRELGRELVGDLGAPGVLAVDEALVRICLGALLGATVWAWVATLSVVAEAWHGRPARRRVAAPLRRLVLLCCGVALAAPVAPVSADEHPAPRPDIAGLPMPDRATGPAHPARPTARPTARPRTVVVRPGDCLWRLAAADLPSDASAARLTVRWQVIYRLNAAVIGPDPDLIHPGQRLALPPQPATR